MAIPIIISAIFHDIDVTRYFNSDNLQFFVNLKKWDKKTDECVYLNREYIFYRISTCIESVEMGRWSH